MRPSFRALVLLGLPLGASACSHDGQPARTSGYEPAMTPAAGSAPSAPGDVGNEPSEQLTEAQITTFARAVNAAEMDQARMAVGRAHDASVKSFAQTMIAEHGQAVKNIDALASRLALSDADSQLATELRVEATRIFNQVMSITDKSFDKRYILGQIDLHHQVLEAIDTRLAPAARRDEIKQLVTSFRQHVERHLQMAETILDRLK